MSGDDGTQFPQGAPSAALREGDAAGAGAQQRLGGPYLLVLPLLGFASRPGCGGAAHGPSAHVPVEVRGADVGRGDGGGGGGERDEGPGPRRGRLVAVLRGHGGVRPDGCGGQPGGRAGRPQRRHRGRGSLRGRHCRVRCGRNTEHG